jgi:transcriptional regulator with XRE-family HTH domain
MEKFGFFSEKLADGMARRGLTEKALARELGCCYAHVLNMASGESLPSVHLLQRMCVVLKWREKKLRRFVLMDRMRKEFGDTFWILSGKNPKFESLYILWEFLTTQEKDYFAGCLRLLVARKQASKMEDTSSTTGACA